MDTHSKSFDKECSTVSPLKKHNQGSWPGVDECEDPDFVVWGSSNDAQCQVWGNPYGCFNTQHHHCLVESGENKINTASTAESFKVIYPRRRVVMNNKVGVYGVCSRWRKADKTARSKCCVLA